MKKDNAGVPAAARGAALMVRGDAREIPLAGGSCDCAVTSPPYYSLRDYGLAPSEWPAVEYRPARGLPPVAAPASRSCLGNEPTPAEYVGHMVLIFRGVRRVLKDRGTLWLNVGDSYGKDGQLIGIPWMLAFALQADGWVLRSEIIWSKLNPKPEGGLKDRPCKAHEQIFLFAKSRDYYYDIDATREAPTSTGGGASVGKQNFDAAGTMAESRKFADKSRRNHPLGKNKRTVWSTPVNGPRGAHFATFPPRLIAPAIAAGCPPGGVVFDPFAGSGTTVVTASEMGRNGVGLELGASAMAVARERLAARESGAASKAPTRTPPVSVPRNRPELPPLLFQ